VIEFHDLTDKKVATALMWDCGSGTIVDLRLPDHAERLLRENATVGVQSGLALASAYGCIAVVFLLHSRVLPRRCSA
jgi:hypothetical protein